MADTLNTTQSSGGTQTSTATPQLNSQNTGVQSAQGPTALDGSAQKNTAVPVQSTSGQPTTLSATSTATAKPTTTHQHHTNYGLSAISVLLFLTAVVLFISTFRSSKNTTN